MRRISVFLAISLSLVPLASAAWSYRGESEPDTIYDDANSMWLDPDTSANDRKVYFSGFQKATPEGDYNANVAALGTRILPVETAATIVLGFWKDCNQDGYVGIAESAALEYRAEILSDDSICAPVTPTRTQSIYPHNDGGWIRELIWIGPGKGDSMAGNSVDNPTNFFDDDVKAWGDYGLPGGAPTTLCPGGNLGFRSVGTILDYADCQTYYRGVRALNDVEAQTGAPTGGWETNDVDNSPSPLNIDNPAYYYLYGPEEPEGHPDEGDYRGFNGGLFGRDNADAGAAGQRERAVTIVDCESGAPDTSPEVNTPDDATDSSTYPSVYESLNDTYVVMVEGNDCDPESSGDEGLPYNVVAPDGYSEPTFIDQGRREVDHAFIFWPGNRNVLPPALGGNCRITQNREFSPGALGYCVPADAGLAPARHDFAVGGAWRANTLTAIYPIYARESLRGDTADFGGWYSTYYAKLGAKTLGFATPLPGQTQRIYGAEACGDNTDGVHGYWDCSQASWEARCTELESEVGPCYLVGETYHMRDVDCWDNTIVRGVPVQAGLSITSDSGPCIDHGSNGGVLS